MRRGCDEPVAVFFVLSNDNDGFQNAIYGLHCAMHKLQSFQSINSEFELDEWRINANIFENQKYFYRGEIKFL
ncbi:hypothetical protein SAMN05444162_2197 [Paenibacillaceae bacterium GAS479]|nr:hypothetical protein SAMN05444162_2197 [Paenibacillaceae bacterium GAS479]